MMGSAKDYEPCPHNHAVDTATCHRNQCRRCGWRPEEETRRKAILREREAAGILRQRGALHV